VKKIGHATHPRRPKPVCGWESVIYSEIEVLYEIEVEYVKKLNTKNERTKQFNP
jgi:hypothetical protein